jgi:hypothetical protein
MRARREPGGVGGASSARASTGRGHRREPGGVGRVSSVWASTGQGRRHEPGRVDGWASLAGLGR